MTTTNTTIITSITWTGGHGRDFEAGARKTDRDREPRAAQEHWVGPEDEDGDGGDNDDDEPKSTGWGRNS